MKDNITSPHPERKEATQMTECFVCGKGEFIDAHHYDCCEGKISAETVPLCRRCHRTYHNFGVHWFDDDYLDKALEVENKRREIDGLPRISRVDIKRSDYWNKIHGLSKEKGETASFTNGNRGWQNSCNEYSDVILMEDNGQ